MIKRSFKILSLIFILLFINSFTLKAGTVMKTVKVGLVDTYGLSTTDKNGEYKGLIIDYMVQIAKYNKWNVEYVMFDDFTELSNKMQNNEIQIAGGVYYSEALLERYAFPDYNCGKSKAVLLSRWDDDRFASYDLKSINGKTIAVNKNALDTIELLEDFLAHNGLTECVIKKISLSGEDVENITELLDDSHLEIDIVLGNLYDDDGSAQVIARFDSKEHFLVTNKDNTEVLDALNFGLKKLYECNPVFAQETFDKNFPDNGIHSIKLNSEELDFIKQKNKLVVAIVNNRPFYYFDEKTNEHRGLVIDILNQIENYTGIEFEYLITSSYNEAIEAIQDDRADIVGVYAGEQKYATALNLMLSESYVELKSVIAYNNSISYPDEGLTCGIVKGTALRSDLVYEKVVEYDNLDNCIKAVEDGNIDFAYCLSSTFERVLHNNNIVNTSVATMTGTTPLSFGFNETDDVILISIFDKAINSIPSETITDIMNENLLYVTPRNLSLIDYIYSDPIIFGVFVVLLFTIIIAVIIINFTIKTKANNAMNIAKQKEAVNNAQSRFLSQVSHEIKTPMNGILGTVEFGRYYINEPSRIKNCFNKIEQSAKHLLVLINDILDMSKIDNERIVLNNEKINLGNIIKPIANFYYNQAKIQRINFQVIIGEEVDEFIIGDSLRINQILFNLLSNAFKFTNEYGKISFKVNKKQEDDKCSLEFVVQDTGCGITSENLEKIFAPFVQESHGTTKQYEGTGLGLAITKKLVELMKGNITVSSEVGKGSTFTFSVPLQTLEQKEYQQFGKNNKIVLVSDDITFTRFTHLLQRFGFEVINMKCNEFIKSDIKEDFIFISENVISLNQRILEDILQKKSDIKVIATGYDQDNLDDIKEDKGYHETLCLPVFESDIVSLFKRLQLDFSNDENQDNYEQYNRDFFKGQRVLVVDDNRLNQEVAKELLMTSGAVVEVAENGKIAVDMFTASPVNYYNMIIMDLQMPIMDGYAATRVIRKTIRPDAANVIIIAMSANTFASDVERCMISGMNGHVSKPFSLDSVCHEYIRILKSKENN